MGSGGDWTAHARTPSPVGGSLLVPYLAVNAAGFMAGGPPRAGGERELPRPLAPGSLLENPYIGQMTLITPPLRVASEEAEDRGTAVSFNWRALMKGQRPLDAGGLAALRRALPDDAQLIYPALPREHLPAGAVNLRLAQSTIAHLLHAGYGLPPAAGVSAQAVSTTVAAVGATPQAMPLPGHIVPAKRPAGAQTSLLPSREEKPGGALPQVGTKQAKRGGALDYLGLPISLAPSLGGRSEVREAIASNVASDKIARIIRPHVFGPLRHALFPAFQSIEAESDQHAWRKAAPAFGIPDSKPTTVLAPQARAPVITPTSSLPQVGGVRPAGPGTVPQMHVADAPPHWRAPGALWGPSPVGPLFGGRPGRSFRPIAESSIGIGPTPALHALRGWPVVPRWLHHPAPPAPPGAAPPIFGARGFLPIMRPHVFLPGAGGEAEALEFMPHMPFIGAAPRIHGRRRWLPAIIPPIRPALTKHPFGGPAMPHLGLPSLPHTGSEDEEAPGPEMRWPTPPTAPDGMRTHTSLASRAPRRLYTPPAPRMMTTSPLAVQRAINIGHVESEVHTARRPASEKTTTQEEREGMQASEINVLATEVWSLLKQRLATEAIRRGRW